MKKIKKPIKLGLARETLKLLSDSSLAIVVGGGPVTTRDLPCTAHTARDCE